MDTVTLCFQNPNSKAAFMCGGRAFRSGHKVEISVADVTEELQEFIIPEGGTATPERFLAVVGEWPNDLKKHILRATAVRKSRTETEMPKEGNESPLVAPRKTSKASKAADVEVKSDE